MKILCTADWHIHPQKEFAENKIVMFNGKSKRFIEIPEGIDKSGGVLLNSRLLNLYEVIHKMNTFCDKNDIQHIIIAGDVFHKRGIVPTDSLYIATRIFDDLLKDKTIYIIAGNHDQSTNSDNPLDSLGFLKARKNVVLIQKPEEVIIDEEVRLNLVPYRHNKEVMLESINLPLDKNYINVLVSHLGISGAYIGNQVYSSDKDFELKELSSKKYDFIVLGHFHKGQLLKENAFYCGSPIQMNFGEESEEKGFWIIDTDKLTSDFYQVKSPEFITTDDTKIAERESTRGNFVRLRTKEKPSNSIMEEQNIRVEIDKNFVTRPVVLNLTMTRKEVIEKYNSERGKPEFLEEGLKILEDVMKDEE